MAYDPSAFEWGLILLGLAIGTVTGAAFAFVAFAFHWKQWYRRPEVPKPMFFVPELYAFLRIVACILAGLGTYLVLREVVRYEFPGLPPAVSTPPSSGLVLAAITLYVIFAFFSGSFGMAFFNIGLQMSWLSIALITEFIAFGTCVTLAIVYGLVWYVPAILLAFSGLFFLYSFIVTCYFTAKIWGLKNPDVYWDPIDVLIQQQESLRSKLEAVIQEQNNDISVPRRMRIETPLDIDEESSQQSKATNSMEPVYPFKNREITVRFK